MFDTTKSRRLNRRKFIQAGAAAAGAVSLLPVLAACSPTTAPAPTQAPASNPAGAASPAAAGASPAAGAVVPPVAANVKTVPRNRTFIAIGQGTAGKWADSELWNPYCVGAVHSSGSSIFYEPLAYYSAFPDKEYMWLAESYKYTPDFKELTIKTRSGIKWSDGNPFSAEDVAYTLDSLRQAGPKLKWGVDVAQFVEEAKATDPNTVVVKFKVPAPRFFEFMTYKYDIGLYIVPKHIFQGQDWGAFKHYDIAKGLPVTTGPWKLVYSSQEQKVIDRRDEWWADKAGLAKMPRVERVVMSPWAGEQQSAQAIITNQVDVTYGLQPATFATVFAQNAKITTWTGQKAPFGNVDWWPISLWLNHEKPPYGDKDVRWAMSYFIDRKAVVDVGWSGASSTWPLPMPSYPKLKPYVEASKALLEKYDTLEFNPKKGEELLTKKGWKKDSKNMWLDDKGQPVKMEIMGSGAAGSALGPVVTELLRRQGIDAAFSLPPDFSARFNAGDYTGAISGHGGGVRDPYATLRLYQSATLAVPGSHQVNFSRWKNPAYDKIVDEIAWTDMADTEKLKSLFVKAMEIWLPELPDVQLSEFHHRVPMNGTYWKNWPTQENPYVNPAFWLLTFAITLWNVDPAQ
jgi:peptide/nickel transport system substrate-binding protein